jgi:hypothetical protein
MVEIMRFLKNVPKSSKTFFCTQKYQNLFLHFDQKKHPLFVTQMNTAGTNLQFFRYDRTMMYVHYIFTARGLEELFFQLFFPVVLLCQFFGFWREIGFGVKYLRI